jgi:2,3-bisphosphoglycerate-dependent phosphoglycerate mutase/probable phosphoglycerate mutase
MTLHSLILLRHGETAWNAGRRLQGHRDIALNELGLRQAAQAAPSIGALAPSVIVASDLNRAAVTARTVGDLIGRSVTVDSRLRETGLGLWEGLTVDEARTGWPDDWAAWTSTSAMNRPPGGESRWEVAGRAAAVVDELDRSEMGTALLVTHGGTIAGLTGRLLGLPHEFWSMLVGVGNCHWVVLHRVTDGSRWRLHTYNAGLGAVVVTGSADSDEVAGT